MRTGVWENIERLVKSPKCEVCDKETNLGGKGKFDLCKEHNNWRTYINLRYGKLCRFCAIASIGWPHSRFDTTAILAESW
jgi:hypothetical protein